MNKWIIPLLLATILVSFSTSFGQVVAIGDRVYTLIDDASVRGLLIPQTLYSKPYTRNKVANLLIQIDEKREKLPTVLQKELDRQMISFKRELRALDYNLSEIETRYTNKYSNLGKKYLGRFLPESAFSPDGHLLSYDFEKNSWINFDLVYDFRWDKHEENDLIFRRAWGIKVETGITSWLTGFLNWQDSGQSGNGPYAWNDRHLIYDDRIGYVDYNNENTMEWEELTGGLLLEKGVFTAFFGRDRVRWGAGQYGNLLMGGETASFPHLSLGFDIGRRIHVEFLTGDLEPWPDLRDSLYTPESQWPRTLRKKKHIAAHRIEIVPTNWLEIGLHESIIYGERDFELTYLNPVSVYFTEEHERGDQDNMLLGLDFLIRPRNGWEIWNEILLDDFQFGQLGSDYFGNKAGITLGSRLAGPGGYLPMEVGCEYSALRPFVYTHIYPVNTYKHWNSPLGLPLEPNSDRTVVWIDWQPLTNFKSGSEFAYIRHGLNYYDEDGVYHNVGGNVDVPHVNGSSEEAPFLAGQRDDRYRILQWFDYELVEGITLTSALGYEFEIDLDREGYYISAGFSWNRSVDRRYTLRKR